MVKIGFDAGHGINTPGKRTPDGEREWSFNNQVAIAFQKNFLNMVGWSYVDLMIQLARGMCHY